MVTVGKHGKDTDSGNAAYFGMIAINLLAGWLHAAAISGRSMDDVLTWALDERDDDPVKILRDHPAAAAGTAAMLDAAYRSPDVTRSNLWTTAQTAIAPLLAPAARATFAPPPGASIDLGDFLRAHGTIYLLASEKQGSGHRPAGHRVLRRADRDREADRRRHARRAARPAARPVPGRGRQHRPAARTCPR